MEFIPYVIFTLNRVFVLPFRLLNLFYHMFIRQRAFDNYNPMNVCPDYRQTFQFIFRKEHPKNLDSVKNPPKLMWVLVLPSSVLIISIIERTRNS